MSNLVMSQSKINLRSYIEELYFEHGQAYISLREYKKDDVLIRQGNQQSKVFILKEGFVKCFFTEDNGKDFIVEFLGQGEIIGEIEAIREINCLCSVQAVSDVTAYSFTRSFFNSLLERNPQFTQSLLNELARRIVNTSVRASNQQLYTVKYGLSKLTDLQNRLNIFLSKQDMAAYLGVDIRSLNRALKG